MAMAPAAHQPALVDIIGVEISLLELNGRRSSSHPRRLGWPLPGRGRARGRGGGRGALGAAPRGVGGHSGGGGREQALAP